MIYRVKFLPSEENNHPAFTEEYETLDQAKKAYNLMDKYCLYLHSNNLINGFDNTLTLEILEHGMWLNFDSESYVENVDIDSSKWLNSELHKPNGNSVHQAFVEQGFGYIDNCWFDGNWYSYYDQERKKPLTVTKWNPCIVDETNDHINSMMNYLKISAKQSPDSEIIRVNEGRIFSVSFDKETERFLCSITSNYI